MLSRLIQQLFNSVGVVFRMIRAVVVRSLNGTMARIRNATSLSRQAAKLAPAMMKTAAAAGKKPTKREDYIETKQLFIAKSFLIMAVVVLIALAALSYLVVWPWLLSQFFTAKLWVDDPDTADYSGKVILYYEREKDRVLFEGRLEEGVIQGKGKSFDENGLLIYSGEYADGIYSGQGTLYTDGTVTYAGGFSGGLYEGRGKLYGKAESLLYEGSFAGGLYEGEGKLYGKAESLLYEGSFSGGLYEGEGKLYDGAENLLYEGAFAGGSRSGQGIAYENGIKRYRGAFENDLYNGEGTLYDKGGSTLYKGGFLDGVYEGDGVLALGGGITVEATFAGGEVLGDARCSADGKLYYEGGLADLLPEGAGVLYGSDGVSLYTGPMKNGAVDGGALLGLGAEEIRGMLGEKARETVTDRGFAIASRALGLTVFCSFAQAEAEPTAYYVYLYEPADQLPAMLWESPEEFQALARGDETIPEAGEPQALAAQFPVELPVKLAGEVYCRPYGYEGYSMTLWSRTENSAPLLAQWSLGLELPEPSEEDGLQTGAAGRLEKLLEQLGLAADGNAGESGGAEAAGNPYYGKKDAGTLLAAAPEEACTQVLLAALTYFESAERRVAEEENLALCQALLQEEKEQMELGLGDEMRLAQLEDMAARLDVAVMRHVVQMRKDARTVENGAGLSVEDYDLQTLAMLFDVAELDVQQLGREAVELAMEAALAAAESGAEPVEPEQEPEQESEQDAEQEPVQESQDTQAAPVVDAQAIRQSVEDAALELELAHQDVQLALREYETASESAAQTEQEYAMGLTGSAQRLTAQMTANEQRAAFYTALVDFARRAAALNETTGGMLARQAGWMPEILGKLNG